MGHAVHVAEKSPSRSPGGTSSNAPMVMRQAALTSQGLLQPKADRCACGGSCPRCQEQLPLQKKGAISEPGDVYEREADRVADEVMRMPAHPAVNGVPPRIQRFAGQATGVTGVVPASVDSALASPGKPQEPMLRQEMEQRFGYDFGSVRVHTDAHAAASARSLKALAYTTGTDIVFGAGGFRPDRPDGKRLLAHELSHVVQQSEAQSLRGTIQRQPAPTPQTPEAPKGLSMRPAPYYLELKNPFTDPQANASAYDTGAAAFAFGMEKLGEKYPTLNRLWVLRLAEMTAGGVLLTTWMTYFHEMGHFREASRFGWDPYITVERPWRATTHVTRDPGTTDEEKTIFDTSGTNQTGLNASNMYVRMALNRDVRYQEGAAYFLTQTNQFFYAARTAYKVAEGTVEMDRDDIFKYVRDVPGWKLRDLVTAAAITNLFSAPVLSSIGNSIAYLWTGQRRFRMPSFKAFGAEVAWPHFQMLLTTKGVTLGGRTVVDFGGGWRAEFTVDTLMKSPDDVSGVAVGAKLHDMPGISKLTPKLHVSPFARGTVAGDSAGYYVGADVSYDLLPHVGISAKIGYRANDLLSEPEGKPDEGLEGGFGLTGRF